MKKILITGGAGFIGSHVVRLFVNKYPDHHIYNLDKLTYAGNLENLQDIEDSPNYTFVRGDITDGGFIQELFSKHDFHGVIHLAAESHVDRSISNPMEFILTNIVGNALTYTPAGGSVTVAWTATDNEVDITVTDTGRGINRDDLDRVFERFYRADRSAPGGTGVGLTIARSLARLHGGDITVASPGEGAGSTFTITLPITNDNDT